MASGENVESAVAGAIIKQCSSYTDLVSEISISILKVAEDIKSNNMSDAMSLVDVSGALTKEAQGFFRKLLDTLKGGVSYGKDAIGDSRVRGTLERLSDNAVAQLQNFYDAMKGFNDVVQETLNVARTATDSGSARLKDAGEETIQLLDNVSIQYDIRPVLDRIRNLPYSRWTIPNEDVGLSESDPMPSLEEGVGSLPDTIEDSGAVGSDVDIDTEVSPSASSGSPSEFISDNIDTAKDVATTLLNNMNQSEEGQEQIMKLISGLGIRMSSLNDLSFNLKKESQFRDQSAMLEKERSMDALRAQRDAIKDRPKKEMDMKKDMMMGLVKRNPYRFLTELMNILGKSQFISFLNNAVKDDASRGSGGRFRKKIKGTFEDIGGSLDL